MGSRAFYHCTPRAALRNHSVPAISPANASNPIQAAPYSARWISCSTRSLARMASGAAAQSVRSA